jgi:hypothetical protein
MVVQSSEFGAESEANQCLCLLVYLGRGSVGVRVWSPTRLELEPGQMSVSDEG